MSLITLSVLNVNEFEDLSHLDFLSTMWHH